jgi:hypothetical protein
LVDNGGYKTLNDATAAQFKNDFLLPLVGYRQYESTSLDAANEAGDYWSSSPVVTNTAHSLEVKETVVFSFIPNRTYGIAVRCFKNPIATPIAGEISYSTTEATNQDVLATLTLNQTGHVVEAGRTATGENDSVFASETQ